MSTPLVLALAGSAAVLISWVAYLATVPSGNVPARPIGHIIVQVGGTALAIAGIVLGVRGGSPGAAVIAPAALALIMGPLFLFLLTQRKTPIGDLRVNVGDTLLPFAAQTSEGTGFHTESLAGRRVLLKFFRGGW